MTERRTDIDGLRALAVVSVLLFHAKYSAFSGGFVGVDVFFVISGFVITQKILQEIGAGHFSIPSFYAKRIRRLYPALILVLLASLVAGWFILWPPAYEALAKEAIAGTLFVPNLLFWSEAGYFDRSADVKPLLHLWSLGIEEQFYLVWPFAIFWTARRRKHFLLPALVAVTALSYLYCGYLTRHSPSSAFYLPFTRLWELSLGGAVSLIAYQPRNIHVRNGVFIAGLIAIIVAIFTFKANAKFPGFIAAIPAIGAAAIIWVGANNLIARYSLSIRPIVYIGLISYPLYLWHWPILSFAWQTEYNIPAPVLLAVSFILAAITYEAIEKRTQRLPSATSWRPLLSGMAVTAAISLVVVANDGFRFRYPSDPAIETATNYDYGVDARLGECWLVDEKGRQDYPPECTSPDTSGAILVVGDSHAARLYPGLKLVFPNTPIWQLTRSSCPPSGGRPLCDDMIDYAVKITREKKPRYVILFAAWVNYVTEWDERSSPGSDLAKTIDRFSQSGTEVIVLGPAPTWRDSLPLIALKAKKETGYIPQRSLELNPLNEIYDQRIGSIARNHSATFVSLLDRLCTQAGCITRVPNKPTDLMSWDYGHLTTAGAEYVASLLAPILTVSSSASAVPPGD